MDLLRCSACGGPLERDRKLGLEVCRKCGRVNHYAFISYSTKNQQEADATLRLFQENGIPAWMAPNDIPVGEEYAGVITDALENCTCMVLLLTNDSQNSKWVRREVELILDLEKPILPVQLEELTLNKQFRFYIQANQILAVPRINEKDLKFQKLMKTVRDMMGLPEPAKPTPEPESKPASVRKQWGKWGKLAGCSGLTKLELGQWETDNVVKFDGFLDGDTQYGGRPWQALFEKG